MHFLSIFILHLAALIAISVDEIKRESKAILGLEIPNQFLSSKSILDLKVDALCNAANNRCTGGGGIDGAIHRAGGEKFTQACKDLPFVSAGVRCPTGSALPVKCSNMGNLKCDYVLQAVGPDCRAYPKGNLCWVKDIELLYQNIMNAAHALKLNSIAIPSISTGIYSCDFEIASRTAINQVQSFLKANQDTTIKEVIFVIFNDRKKLLRFAELLLEITTTSSSLEKEEL